MTVYRIAIPLIQYVVANLLKTNRVVRATRFLYIRSVENTLYLTPGQSAGDENRPINISWVNLSKRNLLYCFSVAG